MTILLAFAFLSGIVTILSPCILPVLPVVLAGNVAGGRARPLGIVSGFVVSFTAFTVGLAALVAATGISPDALRIVAVVIMALFGLVLIIPAFAGRFELLVSRLVARRRVTARGGTGVAGAGAGVATGGAAAASRGAGYWSGAVIGLSIGLVWTPCVGPIMASVISLAVSHGANSGSVFITLAYSLGTSIPMFAIMVGGRALLRRVPWLTSRTAAIQKVFGAIMIVVAVVVAFGWDRQFQNAVLKVAPGYGAGLTAIENNQAVRTALKARAASAGGGSAPNAAAAGVFAGANGDASPTVLRDYGRAPALIADGEWFNSAPLTMDALRGKVVLIDFWTYSCVNCVRTLPYLRAWYDRYKDHGLVIIGVHSPEFTFEQDPANVKKAIHDLDVTWPVVQDNDFKQWNAYQNQYWPAHYFIDAKGNVRYYHFGEGEYGTSESVIRQLLKEAGYSLPPAVTPEAGNPVYAETPETYLGTFRAARFANVQGLANGNAMEFSGGAAPGSDEWSLSGSWNVGNEYIDPAANSTLRLNFDAKNVYLVMQVPPAGAAQAAAPELRITVDGKPGANTEDVHGGILRPTESRMYHVATLPAEGRHLLTIQATGNVRLFSFTFGG